MQASISEIYAALQSIESGPAPPELAQSLRNLASSEPDAFCKFLKTVALDESCVLFEVYESLFSDPDVHKSILASELERLLEHAKATPHSRTIYDQLSVFGTIPEAALLSREVAEIVLAALDSRVPQVRRFAAFLAGDFLSHSSSRLESRLQEMQESDADWRVRCMAYESLRDFYAETSTLRPLPRRRFRDRMLAICLESKLYDFAA